MKIKLPQGCNTWLEVKHRHLPNILEIDDLYAEIYIKNSDFGRDFSVRKYKVQAIKDALLEELLAKEPDFSIKELTIMADAAKYTGLDEMQELSERLRLIIHTLYREGRRYE